MDLTDRKLLNLLQGSFPLEARPFAELGRGLGLAEEEVLRRVRSLKKRGVLRQICAIFDTRALGYQSTLVALRLPPERLDEAASLISRHPGVSHNYARNHSYNLWFTLALPQDVDLEGTVERLAREVGAESVLTLPALRVFKIEVHFDLVSETSGRDGGEAVPLPLPAPDLSPTEIEVVRELQQDLSLASHPFQATAQRLGLGEAVLLEQARDFLRRGLMRRFGAILNHRQAGFRANALGCWAVPLSRVDEVGQGVASFKAVSHCYQRPTYPHWPYGLYTMIHASTREGCEAVAREISQRTGIQDYVLLYSTKEYKKERVRYFP